MKTDKKKSQRVYAQTLHNQLMWPSDGSLSNIDRNVWSVCTMSAHTKTGKHEICADKKGIAGKMNETNPYSALSTAK